MELSYCLYDKKQFFEKKIIFQKLDKIYKKLFDINYNLDIKLNLISVRKT